MRLKTGTLLAAALALSGCSILPAAGPTARQVEATSSSQANSEFVVLNIDDAVVSTLSHVSPGLLSGSFQNRRPSADLRIGAGDVLQISIFEAGGSGLFGPAAPLAAPREGGGIPQAGARGSPLQPVTVDRAGFVFVPFAGRIRVGGQTPERARILIESRLADKAIQPQAQVTIAANGANVATVGGEVGHAQIVPLSLRGDRLLDVLAAAGGAKFPAFESKVRVTRRGHGVTVDLQTVVENSSENIFVQPGDDVYVSKSQRSFTAFGATGHVGYYPFESERQTLAESVAKSGGLLDNIADPSAIYLFRYESPRTVQALLPAFDPHGLQRIPVVYRLNLAEANGYFNAQNFRMRDKDVILAANSDGAQLAKFFTLVRGVTGIVSDIKSITGSSSSSSSNNNNTGLSSGFTSNSSSTTTTN